MGARVTLVKRTCDRVRTVLTLVFCSTFQVKRVQLQARSATAAERACGS